MSALWSGWGSDPFTEQVEKATSELLPAGQEDIALNLDICDQVRAKQVQPKQAMQVIKRQISHKNPNVVLLALGLTDICIKNGGDHFLQEVASREFMDNLVSVLKAPSGVNHDVKTKALGLIQDWAQIAEAKPSQMGYINQVYKTLKSDRFEFPPRDPKMVASAALVETLTAPEWVDGDVCMKCRTPFTTFNRKHHCRNCGNVFCQQCSSHTMSLPWFGIGQDVRVCDSCHTRKAPPKNAAKLSRSKSASSPSSSSSAYLPSGRGGAAKHHRSATLGGKPKRNPKEDDDLALAIKLSLESSGQSGPSSSRSDVQTPSQPSAAKRATRQADGRMLEGTDADDDPDLAAAIAASLRDWAPPQPSAPDDLSEAPTAGYYDSRSAYSVGQAPPQPPKETLKLPPSLELPASDVDALLTFAQTVQAQEVYNQRHGIVGGPPHQQAQALYEKATTARLKMARSLEEGRRRHGVLVSMHDKLTEAVKLYDRLLDAQMARPPHLAGAAPATPYGQPSYDYDPRMAARQQALPQQQGLYPSVQPGYAPSNSMTAYGHPAASAHAYSQSATPQPSHPDAGPPSMTAPHAYQQGVPQMAADPNAPSAAGHSAGSVTPGGMYPSMPYQQPSQLTREEYAQPGAYSAHPGAAQAGQAQVPSQPYHYAQSPAGQPQGYAPSGYMEQQGLSAPPQLAQAYYGDMHSQQTPQAVSSPVNEHQYHHHQQQQQPAITEGYAQQPSTSGEVQALPHFEKMMSPGQQQHAAHLSGGPIVYTVNGKGDRANDHQHRRSTDTLASSQNGWNQVTIEHVSPAVAVAPTPGANGVTSHPYEQQQYHPPQHQPACGPSSPSEVRSARQQQYQRPDTSQLPLFPIAPHPDNGLGPASAPNEISPSSANTTGRSSAGMWQQSSLKQAMVAGESPLIEF